MARSPSPPAAGSGRSASRFRTSACRSSTSVAEDDKVVAHFKCSGTHEGEWRGIAPTGRRFEDVDEIYIFRVRRGRLAGTTIIVEDDLSRLRQLGLLD